MQIGPIDNLEIINSFPAIRHQMDKLVDLIDQVKHKNQFLSLNKFELVELEKAFLVANEAYGEMDANMKYREDGRLFIYHPLEIALYLVRECEICNVRVITGILLHDTLEHAPLTQAQLKKWFGKESADIASDLSQNQKLKASGLLSKKSEAFWQKLDEYVPKMREIDGSLDQQLNNLALKIEHYDRLLFQPAHSLSPLIKVADNLHAYSSIFYLSREARKHRTKAELALFQSFVMRCAQKEPMVKRLMPKVDEVLSSWLKEQS